MADNRAQRGLLISALGAAGLAISIFLPWYSLSITATGAAAAQKQFATVAQQYGNGSLQAMADQVGAQFSSVAGHPIATLSAHQALKHLSLLILLLAGVSLLGSLLRLADVSEVSGDQIAFVGFAAHLCVLYRMVSPPGTDTEFISLSLSWGTWLAFVASAAIAVGGIWTPSAGSTGLSPAQDVSL
jgi:hypothetical protein